ncbi:AraC family transcriptional regulator [Thalassospira mesophila]|uniref:AraC family transcriptional regulator n=1 Tax=Thalassospira mesophila TaxID=1293891 RepID=A0A1Y2KWY4_9PROT|nr:AraC family transcriptional regulator [Thalassospira mesophila]OSQ36727.1 AraC family transcriptional regulator [Thalassospira mesophila]
MTSQLLASVKTYAAANANRGGIAQTPIPGLTTICATAPGGLDYAISRPLVCLVVQGGKQVAMGANNLTLKAGDTLLITADVPTVSQVTQASETEPYLSLVLDLDRSIIADLAVQMAAPADTNDIAVRAAPTEPDVAEAALRLIRLCERPESIKILYPQLVRELHYWLLIGPHGAEIRQLGWPDSHNQRIARAIALMQAEFNKTLTADRLADTAGMSPSSFYQHFRAVTSLSPLQFQKQLRLIEARRLIMSKAMTTSSTAYAVGYESVSQFTREYRRMFGLPPAKDRDSQLFAIMETG